ncbi:MAG TPA: phage terminase large subunit [Pyrinomonadaceae bacterium]|nr:phage terminase large subunit [Pyrinomonadaceae bacterium]HMP64413.1 phage terminase large subunit [Pyrinomonadaceae bacterium]
MKPSCPTENSTCTGGDAREKALELFIKYGGKHHRRIESEMRALGFPTFSRRVFYNRKNRGREATGWIERFGWAERLRNAECGLRIPKYQQIEEDGFSRTEPENLSTTFSNTNELNVPSNTNEPNRTENVPTENSAIRIPQSEIDPSADFEAWLRETAPRMQWDARHQKIIYDALNRITKGENRRLMIMMPPRHGKSELVTIRYAAWRLRQRPETRVIIGSYNQNLANKFSRSIRSVLSESEPPASAGGFLSSAGPRNVSEPPQVCGGPPDQIRNPQRPMFPRARSINTMSEWETAVGGGVKAVGVGAGITGFGGDLVIIDDPIKSRAHAESLNRRDAAWAWFRDDITTRLEPGAAMILIQTRWHEDDIAGRLLRDMDAGGEQWEVLSLPALSHPPLLDRRGGGEADGVVDQTTPLPTLSVPPASAGGFLPLPALSTPPEASKLRNGDCGSRISSNEESIRNCETAADGTETGVANSPVNTENTRTTNSAIRIPKSAIENSAFHIPHSLEALWPERFSVADLLERKEHIGSYSFASLYQQQPSPAEGGIFKRAWFTRIVESAPPGLRWCRGYDLAVSTRTTADRTASFRVAKGKDGTFYIADGFRGRIAFPTQRRYILGRMDEEKNTSHGIESAIHGTAIVDDITDRRGFSHIPLRAVRVDSDKITRSLAWANHAEAGKIALVRGAWIDDFIEELVAFPNGRHDDQIDAVSIAFRMLGEGTKRNAYAW